MALFLCAKIIVHLQDGQKATVFPKKRPNFDQKRDPLDYARPSSGALFTGGYQFSRTFQLKIRSKKYPPFLSHPRPPPLDVTISLRRFMGKMASVRQILPCQPGKHPLSDLYGPDRLPHPGTGSPVIPALPDHFRPPWADLQ